MARAKTGAFDAGLIRTAGLAKALAHPVRIRILEILASRRTCLCGCLVELLPLAQSTVSQHLRELRDAGLIRGEVDGPRTCYCLDPKGVAEARAALTGIFHRIGEPLEDGSEGRTFGTCRSPATTRRASKRTDRPESDARKDPKDKKRSRHENR